MTMAGKGAGRGTQSAIVGRKTQEEDYSFLDYRYYNFSSYEDKPATTARVKFNMKDVTLDSSSDEERERKKRKNHRRKSHRKRQYQRMGRNNGTDRLKRNNSRKYIMNKDAFW